MKPKNLRLSFLLFYALFIFGCGAHRAPVPPGTVPEQGPVSTEEEEYGHEVLGSLTEQYPLDNDDARINRVRDIVDRLTSAAKASGNPWHVYVLKDDSVKNAAATRGNHIFVWTGILSVAPDDSELATVLAHEIGHVLAGHTAPDPTEETSRIFSEIAGTAANIALSQQGVYGPLADLAEIALKASLEAFLVNPTSQADELEADHIGLMLMADAQYDPKLGIQFWERVQSLPDFSDSPLPFLSSHPSSDERIMRLKEYLPLAEERYKLALQGLAPPSSQPPTVTKVDLKQAPDFALSRSSSTKLLYSKNWIVLEPDTTVYKDPSTASEVVTTLALYSEVQADSIEGRWLKISSPVQGYARSPNLAPK